MQPKGRVVCLVGCVLMPISCAEGLGVAAGGQSNCSPTNVPFPIASDGRLNAERALESLNHKKKQTMLLLIEGTRLLHPWWELRSRRWSNCVSPVEIRYH